MAPTVRRAAGRAACWQVADEHTGPGTGRAGTEWASEQGEMLASPVKSKRGPVFPSAEAIPSQWRATHTHTDTRADTHRNIKLK